MEIEGANLYEKIARASNGEIAKIALAFREEELIHARKLEEINLCLTDEELSLESGLGYLDDFIENSMTSMGKEFNYVTRKDFFVFALQREKDSIILYDSLKDHFQFNKSAYQIILELIEEERKHMYYILKILHELK